MSVLASGWARVHLYAMATLLAMAVIGTSSVLAFVPYRFSSPLRQAAVAETSCHRYSRITPSRQTVIASSTIGQEEEVLSLPKDDTFSIWGSWRELTFPGNRPTKWVSKTFDEFSEKTGGAWKTRCLGLVSTTLLAAPMATQWIKKAEANNKLTTSWPESVISLLGEKTLVAGGLTPPQHEYVRSLLLEAIGPSSILNVEPLVEFHTQKYIKRMESYAEKDEVFQLVPLLRELSLDVIVACFLGEIEEDELEGIRSGFNTMTPGMVSIPRSLPWPLSKTPLRKVHPLNFGHAMEARDSVGEIVKVIVDRRRRKLSSAEKWENECILDTVLERQAKQWANGGPAEGEVEIDEQFVGDNVVISLFAGQVTTTSVITRLVHMLTAPESSYAADEILNELATTQLKVGSEAAGGLFSSFPRVRSLALESARLYPPAFGVFRKPTEDLFYNGYKIAKDEPVFWSYLPCAMSEQHYPEPEKVCPFRFLSDKRGPAAKNKDGPRYAEEPGQPKPPLFGFGKHYCPGRELSKLEIILFLKSMFGSFDVHLMEGQDLRGNFLDNLPLSGLQIKVSKKVPSAVA